MDVCVCCFSFVCIDAVSSLTWHHLRSAEVSWGHLRSAEVTWGHLRSALHQTTTSCCVCAVTSNLFHLLQTQQQNVSSSTPTQTLSHCDVTTKQPLSPAHHQNPPSNTWRFFLSSVLFWKSALSLLDHSEDSQPIRREPPLLWVHSLELRFYFVLRRSVERSCCFFYRPSFSRASLHLGVLQVAALAACHRPDCSSQPRWTLPTTHSPLS